MEKSFRRKTTVTVNGPTINAHKRHMAAKKLLQVNVIVPMTFYLIPVLSLLLISSLKIDMPDFGYFISIPYCWMPAAKAIGILIVLPTWRRAARRFLKGERVGRTNRRGMSQGGSSVHPRSRAEISVISRERTTTRY